MNNNGFNNFNYQSNAGNLNGNNTITTPLTMPMNNTNYNISPINIGFVRGKIGVSAYPIMSSNTTVYLFDSRSYARGRYNSRYYRDDRSYDDGKYYDDGYRGRSYDDGMELMTHELEELMAKTTDADVKEAIKKTMNQLKKNK